MTRSAPTPGRTSTEPRAVNRATNSTRDETLACPEVVAYWQQLRAAGHRISLSGCRRLWVAFHSTYTDTDGFLGYALTYLDPTGETAAHRVMSDHSRTPAHRTNRLETR